MKVPDEAILQKVLQWAEYGDEDLRLARHALTLGATSPYRLIAFHAQQCAEKYLKAYLVFRGTDFPFTHSISRLLELCCEYESWADALQEAEELTPYATLFRYPGDAEEVTARDAAGAIQIAEEVRTAVRMALRKAGIELPEIQAW